MARAELEALRADVVDVLVRVNRVIDALAGAKAAGYAAEPLRPPAPEAPAGGDHGLEDLQPKRTRRISNAGRARMREGALRRHANARAAKVAGAAAPDPRI